MDEIAHNHSRTVGGIRSRIKEKGYTMQTNCKSWSVEEEEQLKKELENISEMYGWSIKDIKSKILKLNCV